MKKLLIPPALAAVLVALFVWLAPYYSTLLGWGLRKTLFFLVPLVVVLVIAAIVALSTDSPGAGIAVLVLGAILLIGWTTYKSYLQAQDYASSISVEGSAVPGLEERAPYQVAEAMARPNLGDVAGDITDTSYLASSSRYSTLVKRRGWLSGYETVLTQNIPLQGRGQADQRCDFTKSAAVRNSGWFSHNLGRKIAKERRWISYDSDDIYAYCDSGTPKVVVPLKRLTGWMVVTERPAGVAIYNGKTGGLSFAATAKIPGPAYPLSLASKQRHATNGLGTFGDWFFKRVGWETPDDDVNSGNDAEFTLNTAKGTVYATPLTGRGSATAISVISTVPAKAHSGDLAKLTVHKLSPTWVSPKAIEDKIKADYQDIPNWQNIHVYEVVPVSGDKWVATLGTGQNILYRVSGTGNLKGDQATCLHRADGSLIRCGSLADRNGKGIGTEYGSGAKGSGDVSGMTDEELADLQDRITEEWRRRAK